MSENYGEPWIVQNDGWTFTQPYSIYSKTLSTWDGFRYLDDAVAQYVPDRYSRRITACVNACTGIPTDALEGKNIRDVIDNALRILDSHGFAYDGPDEWAMMDSLHALLKDLQP